MSTRESDPMRLLNRLSANLWDFGPKVWFVLATYHFWKLRRKRLWNAPDIIDVTHISYQGGDYVPQPSAVL